MGRRGPPRINTNRSRAGEGVLPPAFLAVGDGMTLDSDEMDRSVELSELTAGAAMETTGTGTLSPRRASGRAFANWSVSSRGNSPIAPATGTGMWSKDRNDSFFLGSDERQNIFNEFAAEKVPIEFIVEYLIRDARKTRHYTFLPSFVFFMTVLVAMMFLDRVDYSLHNSIYFAQSRTSYDLLRRQFDFDVPNQGGGLPNTAVTATTSTGVPLNQTTGFHDIASAEEYFNWLERLLHTVAELSTRQEESQLVPMDMLLIRQLRRQRMDSCEPQTIDILDPFTKSNLPAECYRQGEELNPVPFGPGVSSTATVTGEANAAQAQASSWTTDFPPQNTADIVFYPNWWKSARGIPVVPGRAVKGKFHSIGAQQQESAEFSEQCYFSSPQLVEECLQLLVALRQGEWLDAGTLIAAVDVVSYYPNGNSYIANSFLIDASATGYWVPDVQTSTFRLYSFAVPEHAFLFFGDLCSLVFALLLLSVTLFEIHENWRLKIEFSRKSPNRLLAALGFWEVLTIALGVLLIIMTVYRFKLWDLSAQGASIDRDTSTLEAVKRISREAFTVYVRSDGAFTQIYELMSFAFLMCGIKFFYFLQYVRGLNVVTTTVRRCFSSLIGLGFLFAAMIFVYSVIGTISFGQYVYGMRTVPYATTDLTQAVISGDLQAYNTFLAHNRAATYLFVSSLYIFFWLFILNLVLGATSSSFLSYQRMEDTDSIAEVFRTYFLLRGPLFEVPHHLEHLEEHLMSPCVRAASVPMRVPESFLGRLRILIAIRREKVSACITLLKELHSFRDRNDAVVTRQRFHQMLPGMIVRRRERIFQMSLDLMLGTTQSTDQAEKKHSRVMEELESIDQLTQQASTAAVQARKASAEKSLQVERLEAQLLHEQQPDVPKLSISADSNTGSRVRVHTDQQQLQPQQRGVEAYAKKKSGNSKRHSSARNEDEMAQNGGWAKTSSSFSSENWEHSPSVTTLLPPPQPPPPPAPSQRHRAPPQPQHQYQYRQQQSHGEVASGLESFRLDISEPSPSFTGSQLSEDGLSMIVSGAAAAAYRRRFPPPVQQESQGREPEGQQGQGFRQRLRRASIISAGSAAPSLLSQSSPAESTLNVSAPRPVTSRTQPRLGTSRAPSVPSVPVPVMEPADRRVEEGSARTGRSTSPSTLAGTAPPRGTARPGASGRELRPADREAGKRSQPPPLPSTSANETEDFFDELFGPPPATSASLRSSRRRRLTTQQARNQLDCNRNPEPQRRRSNTADSFSLGVEARKEETKERCCEEEEKEEGDVEELPTRSLRQPMPRTDTSTSTAEGKTMMDGVGEPYEEGMQPQSQSPEESKQLKGRRERGAAAVALGRGPGILKSPRAMDPDE